MRKLCLILICLSCIAAEKSNCFNNTDITIIKNIITSKNGVFLQVNSGWIAAEALQATTEGIVVSINGKWITLAEAMETPAKAKWKCDICGYLNDITATACEICANPKVVASP